MWQYSKGRRSIVKEEFQPIDEKLPDMITVEHSLYNFLRDYLSSDYFKEEDGRRTQRKGKGEQKGEERVFKKYADLSKEVIKRDTDRLEIGFRGEQSMEGIGCIFDKKKHLLLQAGNFTSGVPQGYAFRL